MQLYLVRHAQSQNNAMWLATNSHVGRVPDPVLSDTGRRQVEHLAKRLKTTKKPDKMIHWDEYNHYGFGITHIYCSFMLRAVETGMGVSKALGVSCCGWIDIHETGGIVSGDGEVTPFEGQPGSTAAYLRAHYPALVFEDQFGEQGWWKCRSREPEAERRPRARRVISTLLERHGATQDHVLMVTHGSFYQHLMRELLGLQDKNTEFALSNTAITRWEIAPDPDRETGWQRILVYSNRLDHLPQELVTW
jgi:2,3-bisphosphoglycerate-dependent phosphoglycerate mutase